MAVKADCTAEASILGNQVGRCRHKFILLTFDDCVYSLLLFRLTPYLWAIALAFMLALAKRCDREKLFNGADFLVT